MTLDSEIDEQGSLIPDSREKGPELLYLAPKLSHFQLLFALLLRRTPREGLQIQEGLIYLKASLYHLLIPLQVRPQLQGKTQRGLSHQVPVISLNLAAIPHTYDFPSQR